MTACLWRCKSIHYVYGENGWFGLLCEIPCCNGVAASSINNGRKKCTLLMNNAKFYQLSAHCGDGWGLHSYRSSVGGQAFLYARRRSWKGERSREELGVAGGTGVPQDGQRGLMTTKEFSLISLTEGNYAGCVCEGSGVGARTVPTSQ